VAFTLEGAVDRSEFGLRWNQALETGGVLVGERVEIEIEAQAVRAAAAQAA
jgi:polyisoprenoid-binding protein YceI